MTRTTAIDATSPAARPPAPPYRLTLDQFRRMVELGVFGPGDRAMLLDGLLVRPMTKSREHMVATRRVARALKARLPEGAAVFKEDAVELDTGGARDSRPEPGVMVLAGAEADYDARPWTPAEVRLVVEVAASKLPAERDALVRYAAAGIPHAWIVDVQGRAVECYAGPTAAGYGPPTLYREHERIEAVDLPGAGRVEGLAATDLLPPTGPG